MKMLYKTRNNLNCGYCHIGNFWAAGAYFLTAALALSRRSLLASRFSTIFEI